MNGLVFVESDNMEVMVRYLCCFVNYISHLIIAKFMRVVVSMLVPVIPTSRQTDIYIYRFRVYTCSSPLHICNIKYNVSIWYIIMI